MTKHNERHGGPFDRGRADYYYWRDPDPHYFVRGTYTSDKVTKADMTEAEIEAYHAGYAEGESFGDRKDWG